MQFHCISHILQTSRSFSLHPLYKLPCICFHLSLVAKHHAFTLFIPCHPTDKPNPRRLRTYYYYFHPPTVAKYLTPNPAAQQSTCKAKIRTQSAFSPHCPVSCSIRFTRFQSAWSLGRSKPVLGSYTGNRWRGQGTILNSWGIEYTKLKIWGTCSHAWGGKDEGND